jgi:hypothetical protein
VEVLAAPRGATLSATPDCERGHRISRGYIDVPPPGPLMLEMEGSLAGVERRSSRRIALEVPLQFEWKGATHHARTSDLSRDGALVLAPITCPAGTELEVVNLHSQRRGRFRVVWAWFGDASSPSGRYKLGLQALDTQRSFWGVSYATPPEGARLG